MPKEIINKTYECTLCYLKFNSLEEAEVCEKVCSIEKDIKEKTEYLRSIRNAVDDYTDIDNTVYHCARCTKFILEYNFYHDYMGKRHIEDVKYKEDTKKIGINTYCLKCFEEIKEHLK